MRIRRKLFHTYANLDLPIQWQDEQVATWAKNKSISTRRDCKAVTSVSFTNNTELKAFTELKWFTGLAEISNSAFYGCTSLEDIALPQGVVTLYGQAFRNCLKLRNITLPSSVRKIGGYAFFGCGSLTWTKVLSPTPPGLDSMRPFSSTTCQFYVPDESVETYKTTGYWVELADRIHPMSEWED